MTRHLSQSQVMGPQHGSRSSPFRQWWDAIRSYMEQMFDKTRDQVNNWRCNNPHALADQVNRSNPETTSAGNVVGTSECFSRYGGDDHRAMI